jgi:hypothetical protein
MKLISKYIILFLLLVVLGIFYRRYEDKRINEDKKFNNEAIQNYLLDKSTLDKSKKPIMWIYVPYEYNSRHWLNWGSRTSFDLNQPYLYLTVKSIIKNCDKSFTICIIDNTSFSKLIPDWSIDMTRISSPISDNIKMLGLMKLLHIYGGMICPLSFLCMKDLIGIYDKGIRNNKMFVCENVNRNITSTTYDFYPTIDFCGAPRECQIVANLIDFIQRTISKDMTSQSLFLGDFDRWCRARIEEGKINTIDGLEIGVKTIDDKQILVDDLLAQEPLNIYHETYGILINSDEILKRTNLAWFARMSAKQVLESNTIIGNYLLVANVSHDDNQTNIIESLKVNPPWVGFWQVPLDAPVWGLMPSYLGDNVTKIPYAARYNS